MKPRPRSSGRLDDYAACVEAALFLALAELAVHQIPFRYTARVLGPRGEGDKVPLGNSQRGRAIQVRWAVQTMARRLPFRPKCLARAIAAKLMLRRRGVACTLYLGLRRRGVPVVTDRPQPKGDIVPHAWLFAGDLSIVGGDGANHAIVGSFR